jgi:hypothetical protein
MTMTMIASSPSSQSCQSCRQLDAIASVSPGAAAAIESPADAAALLPAPSMVGLGGDTASEIAALVLAMARDDRAAARNSRDQQEALARSAEGAELDAMKRHSDDAFAAAMLGGASTAIAGGVTLGGVRQSDGAAKIIEGGGKMAGAIAQQAADEASVDVTASEQLAGRFHRAADEQRDEMKAARDLGDQAATFFKEYVAARADAQKALLFRA